MTALATDGSQLRKFLDEIRRFHEEIASLLGAADGLVTRGDWEIMTKELGGTCWANASLALDHPSKWAPSEVFRWYRCKSDPTRLAYVAVLLQDRKREYPVGFPEPLITAGWIQLEAARVPNGSMHWLVRWHGYRKTRKDDGTWATTNRAEHDSKDAAPWKYGALTIETFARPLALIADTSALASLIVSPLVERATPPHPTTLGEDDSE